MQPLQTLALEIRRGKHTLKGNITARDSLEERLRHNPSALGTRVRMILRIQRIHRISPHRLIDTRHIRPMIHIIYPRILRRQPRIIHKPRRRIRILPGLPHVIRRLARDEHARPLIEEERRCVLQVRREREHRLGYPVVYCLAGLGPRAGAIGPSVVGRERSPVVVPEFDHDVVPGLEDVGDCLEPPFARVGARAASADGLVGDAEGYGVGDVAAPAWVC